MILDTLAASTRKRVEAAKEVITPAEMKIKAFEVNEMQKSKPVAGKTFYQALAEPGMSFICEVKKASPSKGLIAPNFPYINIAEEYEYAGAAAISVLTEPEYFKGSNSYLEEISEKVNIPLLRKDFTIDPYQIYEAKVLGASAVLLICALLDTDTLKEYLRLCHDLNLDALVEAHDEEEIQSALKAGAKIIGVNNRNLKTFEVDFNNSIRLRSLVPKDVLFVAESGVQSADHIRILHDAGVDAVLVGEMLMRSPNKKAILDSWKTASEGNAYD
jgi:indole-3-glycerol phosphate synthase